jgi:hypothetical protein
MIVCMYVCMYVCRSVCIYVFAWSENVLGTSLAVSLYVHVCVYAINLSVCVPTK